MMMSGGKVLMRWNIYELRREIAISFGAPTQV
jgi:hypothetical protein